MGFETIGIVIFVIVMLFSAVTIYSIMSPINTEIQSDINIDDGAKEIMQTQTTNLPNMVDSIIIFFIIMVWIASIISSALLESSPLFLGVSVFFFLFILLIVGIFLSEWTPLFNDTDLANNQSQFPMTSYLANHLLLFIMVYVVPIGIVLYGKYS